MPIYEYICTKCEYEFELMRPFSESDKATTCPKCKAAAKKQLSNFSSRAGGYLRPSGEPLRKMIKKKGKK